MLCLDQKAIFNFHWQNYCPSTVRCPGVCGPRRRLMWHHFMSCCLSGRMLPEVLPNVFSYLRQAHGENLVTTVDVDLRVSASLDSQNKGPRGRWCGQGDGVGQWVWRELAGIVIPCEALYTLLHAFYVEYCSLVLHFMILICKLQRYRLQRYIMIDVASLLDDNAGLCRVRMAVLGGVSRPPLPPSPLSLMPYFITVYSFIL